LPLLRYHINEPETVLVYHNRIDPMMGMGQKLKGSP